MSETSNRTLSAKFLLAPNLQVVYLNRVESLNVPTNNILTDIQSVFGVIPLEIRLSCSLCMATEFCESVFTLKIIFCAQM
jgi:hypothetical protein